MQRKSRALIQCSVYITLVFAARTLSAARLHLFIFSICFQYKGKVLCV